MIILLFDLSFRIVEERMQARSDYEVNHREVSLLHDGMNRIPWKDVDISDVILLQNGDVTPADAILLKDEHEESEPICFIETSQLDGESSLKIRKAVEASQNTSLSFNPLSSKFEGFLVAFDTHQISEENVIRRGSVIKSKHAVALVFAVGADCQINRKQGINKVKTAQAEKVISKFILFLIVTQIALCIAAVAGFSIKNPASTTSERALQFFSNFLLISNMIPISLYVSLRLSKSLQKILMEMTTNGLKVKTMTLNDDLGQITHLFSDKTGTLTCNYMEFRKFVVNDTLYGSSDTKNNKCKQSSEDLVLPHVSFHDSSSYPLLGPNGVLQGPCNSTQKKAVQLFLLNMAVNHSVLIEKTFDQEGNVTAVSLSASSPDEEAFVSACAQFGLEFFDRDKDSILLVERQCGESLAAFPRTSIEPSDKLLRFQILAVLPYSSERKMMSVIVQCGNDVLLFSKGSDDRIFPRLAEHDLYGNPQSSTVDTVARYLTEFGSQGLRTLCFAYKPLQLHEIQPWLAKFKDKDPISKDGREMMQEIETNLVLQGATANQDTLQDDVPVTLFKLATANIKVYVLTGDKVETALNVGTSSCLLTPEHKLLFYTNDMLDKCDIPRSIAMDASRLSNVYEPVALALIIEDGIIDKMLETDTSKDSLAILIDRAQVLIACRSRPDQKAALVDLIKTRFPKSVTLAVGDGANDVAMIKRAHIGVGIHGKEGSAAAVVSDFSITRFNILQGLLLIHGRNNNRNISHMVSMIFYTNLLFSMCEYLYLPISLFSGQKYFVELAAQGFNLLYNGFPIVVASVLERDVGPSMSVGFPYLYSCGKKLTLTTLAVTSLMAITDAVIVFVTAYLVFSTSVIDIFLLGSFILTATIVVIMIRLASRTYSHNILFILSITFTVALWIASFAVFDATDADGVKGTFSAIFGSLSLYVYILFVSTTCIVFQMMIQSYNQYFNPTYESLVREYESLVLSERGCITKEYTRIKSYTTISPSEKLSLLDVESATPSSTPPFIDEQARREHFHSCTRKLSRDQWIIPAVEDVSEQLSELPFELQLRNTVDRMKLADPSFDSHGYETKARRTRCKLRIDLGMDTLTPVGREVTQIKQTGTVESVFPPTIAISAAEPQPKTLEHIRAVSSLIAGKTGSDFIMDDKTAPLIAEMITNDEF
jgi:phospholipid-transporting ATPase